MESCHCDEMNESDMAEALVGTLMKSPRKRLYSLSARFGCFLLSIELTSRLTHFQKTAYWKRLLLIFLSGVVLLAKTSLGQNPAVPVTEVSVKAGQNFSVDLPITNSTSMTYTLLGSARYLLEGAKPPQPGLNSSSSFSCTGSLHPNDTAKVLTLLCQTPRETPAGVYRAYGPVVLALSPYESHANQPVPNAKQEYTNLRLPIVTVTPVDPLPASPPVVFPELGDGQLRLSAQQAFYDGAVRMGPILEVLQKHPEFGKLHSRSNRQALADQLKATAIVLNITRRRYVKAELETTSGRKTPEMFMDFQLRLEATAKLLATTLPQESMIYDKTPHWQLTQFPSTSTTVVVVPDGESLSRPYDELLLIATDMSYGFSAAAKTGEAQFTWTLITVPPGADIFLSSLSHSEFKWEGLSDQKERTLDLARWTFRVSWNGCSKKETPDPFIQNPLTIILTKSGCKN